MSFRNSLLFTLIIFGTTITPVRAEAVSRTEADALVASGCVAGWIDGPLKPGLSTLVSDLANQIYLGAGLSEVTEIRLAHTISAFEIASEHPKYKKLKKNYDYLYSEILHRKRVLKEPIGVAIRESTSNYKWKKLLNSPCEKALAATQVMSVKRGQPLARYITMEIYAFTQLFSPDPRSEYADLWLDP